MDLIPKGLGSGAPYSTPTFRHLCFKSQVIGGEPIAINWAQIQYPIHTGKRSMSLSDLEIDSGPLAQ